MLINPEELQDSLNFIQSFQSNPQEAVSHYYKQKQISPFPIEPSSEHLDFSLPEELQESLDILIARLDHLNHHLLYSATTNFSYDDVNLEPAPLNHIGIYVPYRLSSSLITWASAAKSAGVKNITAYLARNPENGDICPASIYVAKKYQTKILSGPARFGFPYLTFALDNPIDMICGPAGKRLNILKQLSALIAGKTTDFFAGPSEIAAVVFSADKIVSAIDDLAAQMEHGKDSRGYLILVGEQMQSEDLQVAQRLASCSDQVQVIRAKDLKAVAEIVNEIAPETVEILGDNKRANELSAQITNCGVLYINASSSLGDYMAIGRGCADPTQKTAISSSGISPFTFLRYKAKINPINPCLKAKKSAQYLADYEHNHAHLKAISN